MGLESRGASPLRELALMRSAVLEEPSAPSEGAGWGSREDEEAQQRRRGAQGPRGRRGLRVGRSRSQWTARRPGWQRARVRSGMARAAEGRPELARKGAG